MKTEILEDKNRMLLEQKIIEAMCEDRVTVNTSMFFDWMDEKHKAIISYYE